MESENAKTSWKFTKKHLQYCKNRLPRLSRTECRKMKGISLIRKPLNQIYSLVDALTDRPPDPKLPNHR